MSSHPANATDVISDRPIGQKDHFEPMLKEMTMSTRLLRKSLLAAAATAAAISVLTVADISAARPISLHTGPNFHGGVYRQPAGRLGTRPDGGCAYLPWNVCHPPPAPHL